jgi:hypothetical protein
MGLGLQIAARSKAFVNILRMFEAERPLADAACNPMASRLHLTCYSPMRSRWTGVPGSLDEHP